MTSNVIRSYLQAAAPDRHVISYDLSPFEDTIRQASVHGFKPTVDMPFHGLHSRAVKKPEKLPVYCTEPIPCKDGYLRTQRIIVSAANRFHLDNGQVLVIAASRHGSPLMHDLANFLEAQELMAKRSIPSRVDQGFIDNFDNYWSRAEAMLIATHAGQVNLETNGGDTRELYSEGLY
jgi:hypothetical protein